MIYKLVRLIVKIIFFPLFRIKVYGINNVPKKGPFILASNHFSNLDPMVLGITCPRMLNYLAKEELFNVPVWGWLLYKLGAFPLKRGKNDIAAFKKSLSILSKGLVLMLFPQGARGSSKTKKGVGVLAKRSEVPIVPVHISNTGSILPPGKKIPCLNKIEVFYKKPLRFNDSVSPQEITETVFGAIRR